MDGLARLESLGGGEQDFGGRIIVRGGIHLLQVDARRMASQGFEGGKSPAQVNVDLSDAGGVELNMRL